MAKNVRKDHPVKIIAGVMVLITVLGACSSGTQADKSPEQDVFVWEAQDALNDMTAGEITKISYTTYTEGGVQSGETDDEAEIEEIYLRLCNLKAGDATTEGIEDDGLKVEVQTTKEMLTFDFEGDILVIDRDTRYKVSNLSSLKGYVNGLLEEEAEEPEEPADAADDTAPADVADALPKAADEKVFAGGVMDFSFLYDDRHTGYITTSGEAELAINGEESLVGLYVAVADSDNMPEVSEVIAESMYRQTQKYLNAIAMPPAEHQITAGAHTLNGYTFSYSTKDGRTVDATWYMEERDGKYIYYATEMYRDADDYWAGQEALEKAVNTLQLSYEAYGKSDATVGEIGTDNSVQDAP